MKAAFFSRGRGRGHAIPDIAIADELSELAPDIQVTFVSYGTGADTFRAQGREVIDLQMPDDNPPLETLIRASRVIGQLGPAAAIAHEEPMAVPACRIFGVPSIFLTEWFIEGESIYMQALHYAEEIAVLAKPGITDEPPYLQGRIRYVGNAQRRMAYARADRGRARQELGIPAGARVVSVFPGSTTEARAPLADVIEAALDRWPIADTLWYWVAGGDKAELEARFAHRPHMRFLSYISPIEQLMCATDVAITKANRKSVFELEFLGVPAVSVTRGLNPMDDLLIAPLANNRTVSGAELTPDRFTEALLEALARGPQESTIEPGGARRAAAAIALFLRRSALARLVR